MTEVADLPFADPADIVELTESREGAIGTLFTDDEISSWAGRELQDTQPGFPAVTNVIRLRSRGSDRGDPPTIIERGPPPRPKSIRTPSSSDSPPRNRLRYQIAPSFAAPAVSVAPAARSSRRFTERSAISDAASSTWQPFVEVASMIVVAAIAIWWIISF